MKYLVRILGALIALLGVVIVAIQLSFSQQMSKKYSRPEFTIAEEVKKADVELGKRIYAIRAGCIECHGAALTGTPVMNDPGMGRISGANITPATLKSWTDEEIAVAIRYGIHKEGRSLRFMPSFDYQTLSKGDIAALIAYLRSVPEVVGEQAENTFGPLARLLSVIGQMPVMFPAAVVDSKKGFSDKPEEGATREFGRYLAGACMGCHGENFKGGKIPGGDPAWPLAADIRMGANPDWNEDKFKSMILTGNSPKTGQPLRSPMPIALLKQMNDTEIKALWLFLSTVD